jgi:hypothetical protein
MMRRGAAAGVLLVLATVAGTAGVQVAAYGCDAILPGSAHAGPKRGVPHVLLNLRFAAQALERGGTVHY